MALSVTHRAQPHFPGAGSGELGEHVIGIRKMRAHVPDVHIGVAQRLASAQLVQRRPSLSWFSIHCRCARTWSRICGIAAVMAAMSNSAPRSVSRSAMKILRDLIGKRFEHQVPGVLKERAVG